ncbi:response regulator [Marinobacter sediminum]|uniref:response regulator n=1 Tax=Marinobacter sediminum TaxID=256323 RepID=UPI003566873F
MTDILILDDDEQILLMTRTMLEREGYQVTTATRGQDALATLENQAPALLITDILMPAMDGIDVINECRKRFPQLAILAMSGGRRKISAEFNLKSARMLGAEATLAKPFSKSQLISAVARLLRN